ncbi:MAG TPA: hypothetical protein VGM10_28970 [Actinocrinis sp.]|jgi:hypothetical protein
MTNTATDAPGLDPAALSATAPAETDGALPTALWPAPYQAEPPLPLLAPYFGVVAAMLCMLIGGWLLLAPFAFDYRHAAAAVPQSTTVDLVSGVVVLALAALTAALFAGCIARRLRAGRQEAESVELPPFEAASGDATSAEPAAAAEQGTPEVPAMLESALGPDPDPILAPPLEESFSLEPHKPPLADPDPSPPEAEPRPAPQDPGGGLLDLLAPLVAALTADLNSRERERDHDYGNGASRGSAPSGGHRPDA